MPSISKLYFKDCVDFTPQGIPVFCTKEQFLVGKHLLQAINITNRLKKDNSDELQFPTSWVAQPDLNPESIFGKATFKKLKNQVIPGIAVLDDNSYTFWTTVNGVVHLFDPENIRMRHEAIYSLIDWVGKNVLCKK
jgi:hypothetical protein